MEPLIGWVADQDDFEVKKLEVYTQALEFDGISPVISREFVISTKDNPYAEAYRKMLH